MKNCLSIIFCILVNLALIISYDKFFTHKNPQIYIVDDMAIQRFVGQIASKESNAKLRGQKISNLFIDIEEKVRTKALRDNAIVFSKSFMVSKDSNVKDITDEILSSFAK
ncbi:hypothetical protein ACPDI4_000496 [Campylobacter upsaliensis]